VKNYNLRSHNSSLESLLKQFETSQSKSIDKILQAPLQFTIFIHQMCLDHQLIYLIHVLFHEEEWVSPTQNTHILMPDKFSPPVLRIKI